MGSITIRRLDDATKERLRAQAARHGRSMEEEARAILTMAVATPGPSCENLAELIRRRFEPLGGVELEIPPRSPSRPAPDFTA